MWGENQSVAIAELVSAADWWHDAGVDMLVDDTPRNWLAPAKPAVTPDAAPDKAPVAVSYPAPLASFRDWLASADIALAGPPASRLSCEGDPASGLMIVTDMPEIGDAAAGRLMSGDEGLLFDRMLAAIGRDRSSVYLVTLSMTRTPDGKIDDRSCRALVPIAMHHIALAKPRAVLALGDCAVLALLDKSLPDAQGHLHQINQGGANIACVATFHPRFLLGRPRFKRDAWQDLRLLLGELSR